MRWKQSKDIQIFCYKCHRKHPSEYWEIRDFNLRDRIRRRILALDNRRHNFSYRCPSCGMQYWRALSIYVPKSFTPEDLLRTAEELGLDPNEVEV